MWIQSRSNGEKHPPTKGEDKFIVLKGKVGDPGRSGNRAGRSWRVGGALDLRGAAGVYPIDGVRVLGGPERFVKLFLDRLTEELLDFHVAAVCEFDRGDPRLLGDVEVVLFFDGVYGFLDIGDDSKQDAISCMPMLSCGGEGVAAKTNRGSFCTSPCSSSLKTSSVAAIRCASTFSPNSAVLPGGNPLKKVTALLGDARSTRGMSEPAESGAKY